MRTPGNKSFTIYKGKLFDTTLTWKINSAPVDLTGYTATLRMENPDDGTTQLALLSTTLDGSGNGIIMGGSAGTVRVLMKSALTDTFDFAEADYDLTIIQPDGEKLPFLEGRMSVVEGAAE